MPRPHRLLAPLLLVALAFLLRAPSWPISVIDWDESMFALAGRELLSGHLPYTTMFDNKPVGLSLLFAAAMAVGGETVVAVRALGGLSVAATAVLLCLMTQIVTGRRAPGFAAGLLYIAFSTGLHGLATHSEIVLAPFVTAGVLLAVLGRDCRRPGRQLAAMGGMGMVFGLALTVKQVAAAPAATIFLMLVLRWWKRDGQTLARAALLGAVYAVLCGLTTLMAVALYATEGKLAAFWYANVGFMGRYVAERPSVGDSLRFITGAASEFWPLLLLGAGGRLAMRSDRVAPVALILGGWLAAEAVAALASLQFYSHHFLLLLPPLSVLAAITLSALSERWVLPDARVPVVLTVAAFLALIPLVPNLHAAGWAAARDSDLPRRVADAVRAAAGPGDLAWVVNFQPIVYLLAGLPLPTAMPFPPHLVGEQSRLSPIDPDAEITRILSTTPKLLVVDRTRWPEIRPRAAKVIGRALSQGYTLLTTVTDGPQRIEIHERR